MNSFLIVYLRTWNSLLRKHFYQNFSNLISKLSDVICNRCSCISLNFTFTFNAEQENQFSHATRCWDISNELSMCCRFPTNWLLRKLASRRRSMQHNIKRYFFSSNKQLLFMVIKKTGKWPSKGPLWYCRNVSNASWLNLFLCIECFWIQIFKHIISLVRNSPPST